MSDEQDTGQTNTDQRQEEADDPERAGQLPEKPEPDESARQKAEEMFKTYDDDIKTAVLPGSDRTITGTAINAWLDDDGNPKYGNEDQKAENTSEGGSEGEG